MLQIVMVPKIKFMSVNIELKEYVKDKKELTKSKGCQ